MREGSAIVAEKTKVISGVRHAQIRRSDGFGFYLDPAFFFIFKNHSDPDMRQRVMDEFHLTHNQVNKMIEILIKADLLSIEDL